MNSNTTNVQLLHKNKLIIFDWDDTLFPTTDLKKQDFYIPPLDFNNPSLYVIRDALFENKSKFENCVEFRHFEELYCILLNMVVRKSRWRPYIWIHFDIP